MIGKTILHYNILEKLGEGGMGIVYKAEDIKLKRIVALKFLPPYVTSSAEDLARFNQEAQSAAALNHPNICTIYAIEEAKEGVFIAMEYIDGITLNKKIGGSPLKVNDAISWAVQVGEALQEAHNNGIVHRDIKSENIMINSKNQVKVMDFGLAKLKGSIKLTRSSTTAGTLAYMAPEQIKGEEIDARSDIFSFGVVFYEMLTGRLPFAGEHDASMMYSILNDEPEPLQKYVPEISSDILHIINRALEKDPEDRYQSVKDIVIELRRMQKRTGNVSRKIINEPPRQPVLEKKIDLSNGHSDQPTKPIPTQRPAGKKKLVIGLSAAGLIAVLIIAALLLFNKTSEPSVAKSIAVLPFKNLNSDKNDEYFSDGITEDITVELSQIADLKVIARNSVMKYKNSDASIKEIGTDLGVSSILEGSIQKEGNQVRIVAQLIDVNTGKYLWAGTYDKELTRIFDIQSDVSKQIANALKSKLTPEEITKIDKQPTGNITAYQFYLKGRDYYYRYNKDANENAIDLFKKALALDPGYALAYAGFGDCYGQRVQKFGYPTEWNDSALTAAKKAISLDPKLAEGYKALGLAQFNKGWMKLALESNKAAIKLNPNYWPAIGNIGVNDEMIGDLAIAVSWDVKANQLNPIGSIGYIELARVYFLLNDFQNAEKQLNFVLNMQPDFILAYETFAQMHFDQGNNQQVIKDCEKALSITPDEPITLRCLSLAYMNLGNYDKAESVLKKIPANGFWQTDPWLYLSYLNKKKNNIPEEKKLVQMVKNNLEKKFAVGDEYFYDALSLFFVEIVEGNKPEAYKWLNKSVDLGFREHLFLLNNPITEYIRNDKQFLDAVQNIKNKVHEQQTLLASMNLEK
jgi:serine/threonine protein kinase/Flp pilus assembly protein TadD